MTDASILAGAGSGTNESDGMLRVATATVPLWLARLDQTRVTGTDGGRPFRVPSDDERAVMREAMLGLLRGELDAARGKLALVGFVLEPFSDGVVLVREHENDRHGGGAFVVRQRGATAPRLCIQAPHSFDDEHTLPIAVEIFARTGARALFTSTACASSGDEGADVTHSTANFFHAATEGFVQALAGVAAVVQVHGFRDRCRGSRVILSGGACGAAGPVVQRTARALRAALGDVTSSFVKTSEDIPAFMNAQSALGGTFVHVELGASLRRDVMENHLVRELVTSALASGLTSTPVPPGIL